MVDLFQRLALYHAHNERCVYCREPILFSEMSVDHILPQTLLKDLPRRERVLADYGLPDDFDIESYNNWLPCHQGDNRQKGDTIFPKANCIFFIGLASDKAETAKKIEGEWRASKKNDRHLYHIQVGLRNGTVSINQLTQVVIDYQQEIYPKSSEEVADEEFSENPNEPIVITFGLTMETVYEQEIYDEETLDSYPNLCDRLQADLITQLSSLISCKFFVCEDYRDGEAFSVRIAFENPDPENLSKFTSEIWEVLEIMWYSEIYGEE
jgi:hypothetical protein